MVGRKTSKPRPSSCPLTNCSQWLWVQRAYQRRVPLSIISEIRFLLPLTRSDKAPPPSVWPWFPIPNLHCLSSRSRRYLFAESRRLRFSEHAQRFPSTAGLYPLFWTTVTNTGGGDYP